MKISNNNKIESIKKNEKEEEEEPGLIPHMFFFSILFAKN